MDDDGEAEMKRNRESSTGQKRTETELGPIGAFHAVTEYDLASGAGRVVGTGIGPPTPGNPQVRSLGGSLCRIGYLSIFL
jgi:hypothetical protein